VCVKACACVGMYVVEGGEAGGGRSGSMCGAVRPPVPHTCADGELVGRQSVA